MSRWQEVREEAFDGLDTAWWIIRDFMFEFAIPVGLFLGIELLIMLAFGRLPLP